MTDQVIVSTAFDKLNSMLRQEKQEGLRLVVCVEEEFRKFFNQMLAIREVLEDAESRQIDDLAVGYWLHKLKYKFYDIEEMFDEWTTAIQKLRPEELEDTGERRYSTLMRKVCSSIRPYLMCNKRVRLHGEIALKIKYVSKTLHDVSVEKDEFNFKLVKGTRELKQNLTASFVGNMSKVHGRDEVKDEIVNFLVSGSGSGEMTKILPIISVVGPRGIGKTTLAREVFNDEKVKNHFNKKIWVCAYPFNKIRVATTILESLSKDDASSNFVEWDSVLWHISRCNKKENFLLVLDDVHFDSTGNYWEQLNHALKCSYEGSRILVTSLDKNNGLKSTESISLERLSDNDSWSLCHQIALSGRPNDEERKILEEIGQKIIKKYHGLPLGIKILGSLLRFKTSVEEWKSVLDSEIWELEEVKGGSVFPLLLLSYYDLPFILRKCFLYCAIFPNNYEIKKDRLIKLWMSQSYLIKLEEERDDMELIGEEYFDHLAMRSFFQDFQLYEDDGSIISCKLHDSVSEFARFLAENECFHMEATRYESSLVNTDVQHLNIYVRHLMITLEEVWSSFPTEVYAKDHKERLRSLLVEPRGGFMSNVELSKLFDQLTCLRALDLSNQDNSFYKLIKEVPGEIKNFVHLRYLNFSNNKGIRELPETICELSNLQTLEVNRCRNLKTLPQRMEKLINLRHIVNDETSLSYLPKGIEKLTRLRTLSEFIVCRNGGNGSKACTLQSLKDLKHLRGCLSIKKLGNHEEKKKPSTNRKEITPLQNKESLLDVCLCFRKDEETGMGGNEDHDEKFLENLQLPPNLMRLKIVQYSGKVMSSKWVTLLKKLRFLSLNHCMKLDNLPPLGKLSSLESLIIRSSRNVERVGNEFLGLEITDSKSSVEAFPKLKHLEFQDMKEWKGWNYGIAFAKEENVKIMERIESLTIAFCPKLETLPDYIYKATTLKELKIISCPKLKKMKDSIKKRVDSSGSHPKIDFTDLKYIEKGSH